MNSSTEMVDFSSKTNPIHAKNKSNSNGDDNNANKNNIKYIAATVRKRYVRHTGTQFEDDGNIDIDNKDESEDTEKNDISIIPGQNYLDSSKILKLPWLVNFVEKYFFGRFDFRITYFWYFICFIGVGLIITSEIREFTISLHEFRGCDPMVEYSTNNFTVMSFFWLTFVIQLIETIRFNHHIAKDRYFQGLINKICVIIPDALKDDNDKEDDNDNEDNDNSSSDEEENRPKKMLNRDNRKKNYLYYSGKNDKEEKTGKVNFNRLAYFYMVIYAIILWSILGLFVIGLSCYASIRQRVLAEKDEDQSETDKFFENIFPMRYAIWLMSSLISTISAMQWLWVLRVLHGSLLHYANHVTLDDVADIKLLEKLIHIQAEIESITGYWSVNHMIRIGVTFFQIFGFGWLSLFFFAQLQALNTAEYSEGLNLNDAATFNLAALLLAFLVSMVLLLVNSLVHVLYAGYINDSYGGAIRDKLKSLMLHFTDFELDSGVRQSVVTILQGFSSGGFESGILYASFHITVKQALVMFSALSYIAFFFVTFHTMMMNLLEQAVNDCFNDDYTSN